MKNWAGNIHWQPSEVAYPTTEMAIQELVLRAANERKKIRVIGTGHSFTALCKTSDILISLDQYQGLVKTDQQQQLATVKAGTKLSHLGKLLFEQGLAMENLGDIDVQSIAGTISTGTHGTGVNFGTISTQVKALRLINGKGEVVICSETENQELFKAAQISMGALGIITEVTLQCVSAYKLQTYTRAEAIETVFSNLPERLASNRNFEFFWLPNTNTAITKTTNVVDTAVDKHEWIDYLSEMVIDNFSFKMLCELQYRFPAQTKSISKLTARLIAASKKVNYSYKIYATQRLVKFKEMEYNIPAAAYQEVWKEVVKTIEQKDFKVYFPIENRWVKGDNILMSPAYGRDSAYVACHVYYKKDEKTYFKALEDIFRAYDGRPHWGKMHTLDAKTVAGIYPGFATFIKHRNEQDPDKLFLSPYLEKVLGFRIDSKMVTS